MSNSPLATRKFTLGEHSTQYIEVFVYLPVEDHGDYRCQYEIREQGKPVKKGHALGVDSLQALILALQKLGADVAFSNYAKDQRLYWNDQNADLGLLLPRGV